MTAVITALGTMAVIIGAGWLLGHRGTLGESGLPILARACFAVATPCLLLGTVAHTNLHLLLSRSALVAALTATAVTLVAVVVLALFWRRAAPDVVVGTLAASYVNAGNLGLPLAVYLLGDAVAVVPDVARLGHPASRVGPACTVLDESGRPFAVNVGDDERAARGGDAREDVSRHRPPHHAQSDETNVCHANPT